MSLAGQASLFAGGAEQNLSRLRDELAPLAASYDVVVANPPYMGSLNMGRSRLGGIRIRLGKPRGDGAEEIRAPNVQGMQITDERQDVGLRQAVV